MPRLSEQQKRIIGWTGVILCLVGIVCGYWLVNGRQWRDWLGNMSQKKLIDQNLTGELREIKDAAVNDLQAVNEQVMDDFEIMARQQQEDLATETVIEKIQEKLEISDDYYVEEEENSNINQVE